MNSDVIFYPDLELINILDIFINQTNHQYNRLKIKNDLLLLHNRYSIIYEKTKKQLSDIEEMMAKSQWKKIDILAVSLSMGLLYPGVRKFHKKDISSLQHTRHLLCNQIRTIEYNLGMLDKFLKKF